MPAKRDIRLAENVVDDVLTYALFPQIGLMFLENRDNPDAFEPAPWDEPEVPGSRGARGRLREGRRLLGAGQWQAFTVEVAESGQLTDVAPAAHLQHRTRRSGGEPVNAVLAGNIFKVHVAAGATVEKGDPLLVVEAMKMETVVASPRSGTITEVFVAEGDTVAVGDALVAIG